MGETNRSFINPFQVAAKCGCGGLDVIFVNEVPSGTEPCAPFSMAVSFDTSNWKVETIYILNPIYCQ